MIRRCNSLLCRCISLLGRCVGLNSYELRVFFIVSGSVCGCGCGGSCVYGWGCGGGFDCNFVCGLLHSPLRNLWNPLMAAGGNQPPSHRHVECPI